MKRIGVLTSGGDSPGMNAAVRAVVRSASWYGIQVIAYLDGFTGLVENRTRLLDDRSVGNIIQLGGTFIGTSRSTEFMKAEVRAACAARMKSSGVEGLVVIGGDGSFRGALSLQDDYGVRIAGIPGTIDNDVWGTEETVGFDTAVNTAVSAIDNLRDTGESTSTMFFVEVMGRSSGDIAALVALAGGAAGVAVPGDFDEVPRLIEHLRGSMAAGKRSHIIVCAEGEELGGAFGVAKAIGAELGGTYRVVVLGHIQRGGRPSARDRIIASRSGEAAVRLLAEGRSGLMVGMQDGEPVEVPLKEVVANHHPEVMLRIAHLAEQLAGR